VRDVLTGAGEQRRARPHEVVELGRALAGRRADADRAVLGLDRVQALDAVDVDDHGRRREARVHQPDEALPAGEHAGVVAVPGEMVDRLREGARRDVVERSRFQREPPMVSPPPPALGAAVGRAGGRAVRRAFQNHL
jgi:hypothetical protein